MRNPSKIALFLFVLLFITNLSCDRKKISEKNEGMRIAKTPSYISDDLDFDKLGVAIEKDIIRFYETDTEQLTFGPKSISKQNYIKSLKFLSEKIKLGISKEDFFKILKNNFDFYEVYGKDNWGEVFITSYFHPVISGSRERTPKHSQALYSVPPDLVTVHFNKFVESFDKFSTLESEVLNNKSKIKIFRGRVSSPYVEGGSSNIIPYYSREEIDSKQKLKDQNLELAWVDPIDAFFLHVQGSGTVKFEDGEELILGYASQNGHPYFAISKFLPNEIPKEKITMQVLEKYLRSLPYVEMRKILYKNPSYIFFRVLDKKGVSAFGTEVVAGRTIATDRRFFPKGALAYLEFPKPIFKSKDSIEPDVWEQTSRLVLDQDTGGAIQGPHRVDLFWGSGKESGRHAGVMKNFGRLYYLVPKDDFLSKEKAY